MTQTPRADVVLNASIAESSRPAQVPSTPSAAAADGDDQACCCSAAMSRHWSLLRSHGVAFHAPSFLCAVAAALYGTLVPVSLRALHENDATIGLVASAGGGVKMLCEIPVSFLSHRFGPWIVSLVGCICMCGCIALPAFSNTVWAFATSSALVGVATVMFATPRHEMLAAGFPSNKVRTTLSGHFGALARTSYLFGPPLGGILYEHVSPAAAYLAGAGFAVLLSVVFAYSPELRALDNKILAELEAKRRATSSSASAAAAAASSTSSVTLTDYREQPLLVDGADDGGDDGDDDDGATDDDDHDEEFRRPRAVPDATEEAAAPADDGRGGGIADLYTRPSQARIVPVSSVAMAATPRAAVEKGKTQQQQPQKNVGDDDYCSLFGKHWTTVLGVGMTALTVMAVRQVRRLAITLSSLNEGYGAKSVGLILAASFLVDTLAFWVCAYVTSRWGFRAAITPLLLFYAAAFAVLSISSKWSLFVSLPLFGIGDAFGAGIILATLAQMIPRRLIGAARLLGVDAGQTVGPLLCGTLSHAIGIEKMLWVFGAWSLVAGVFAWFYLGDAGRDKEDNTKPAAAAAK